MLCESCTERGNSSVQEAGEDGYGSEKATYISGIMWIDDAKRLLQPHDPRMGGKCLSLSVCVSVCIQPDIAWIFFPGGVRTSYCKGNRETGSNRRMW